jgi:hypothetical protein
MLTHFGIQSETFGLEITSITVGGGVTVVVGVGPGGGVSVVVSIGVCAVSSVVESIRVSLGSTLGHLVDDTGGRLGVVAGDLVGDWGGNDGGVVVHLGDGVGVLGDGDGSNSDGLGLRGGNLSLRCGDLSLSLRCRCRELFSLLGNNWCGVDVWVVVVVVHGGVGVCAVHGGVDDNWGSAVCLVHVCTVGVVVMGVGFRLGEGHGGKSENYELKMVKIEH